MSAPDAEPGFLAQHTELPSVTAASTIAVDTRLTIIRMFIEKLGFGDVRVLKRANGSIDITLTEAS